jgi:hypothetical protein
MESLVFRQFHVLKVLVERKGSWLTSDGILSRIPLECAIDRVSSQLTSLTSRGFVLVRKGRVGKNRLEYAVAAAGLLAWPEIEQSEELNNLALRNTVSPFLKAEWERGVKDSIRVVEDRKQYLQGMGPAKGVIEVLDEVLTGLQSMLCRGSYSSHSELCGEDKPGEDQD